MRDARPLDADQVVHLHFRAVIFLVQPLEDAVQQLRRQRLTGLGALVRLALELGEKRLPIERGAEGL